MRLLTAMLMAAVLAPAACVFDDDVGEAGCADDSACGDGRVCAVGLCLDPADQRLRTVDVEVDASGVGAPVQNVFDVDLGTGARVEVALAPPVLASGTVVGGDAGIAAYVVARPGRAIPGRGHAPSGTSAADGTYQLTLVDGLRYAFTALPEDPRFPPLYEDAGFEASASSSGTQSIVPLTVPATVVRVAGVVQAGGGVEAVGIEALEVRLRDEEGRTWSSVARTAADGSFAVVLAEPRDGLTLEVRPSADNPTWPVVVVPGVDASADVDLGIVSLGAVVAPRQVIARVFDAAGAPTPNAWVVMRASVGAGVYTHRGVSLADGRVDERVPPGVYDIVVTPPAGVEGGGMLVVEDVVLPPAEGTLNLRLPTRATWSGRVRDEDGAGVPAATLEVARVGDARGEPEPALAELPLTVEIAADEDADFSVALDPGLYRVTVRPPVGAGLPRASVVVTMGREPLRQDIALPPRALVAGSVELRGGRVAGAWVKVFSALVDEAGSAILLGEGPVDVEGDFEVVVPDLIAVVDDGAPPGAR